MPHFNYVRLRRETRDDRKRIEKWNIRTNLLTNKKTIKSEIIMNTRIYALKSTERQKGSLSNEVE